MKEYRDRSCEQCRNRGKQENRGREGKGEKEGERGTEREKGRQRNLCGISTVIGCTSPGGLGIGSLKHRCGICFALN